MSRYGLSRARPQSICSDGETTPERHTPGSCTRDLRRLRERLQQAESDLRANKQVIKDHQLAKCRKALLPMAVLNPGLVLGSVPKGHFASAKEF
ncbi:hypothetical protein WJX82_004944 [Trebouxia sp. C0006]